MGELGGQGAEIKKGHGKDSFPAPHTWDGGASYPVFKEVFSMPFLLRKSAQADTPV